MRSRITQRRPAPNHRVKKFWPALVPAIAAMLGACEPEAVGGLDGSSCVSTEEVFAVAYFKVIRNRCATCHSDGSVGSIGSDFDLRPASEAGFLDANFESIKKIASYRTADGTSFLLEKPLGRADHGGGTIFSSEDDEDFQVLKQLSQRIDEEDSCPSSEARFLAGVELLGPEGTFQKAALVLGGRNASPEELEAIRTNGFPAVDALLDGLLKSEPFYARLKEKYNDVTLTDFYLNGEFDVIGSSELYNPRWYEDEAFLASPDNQLKYGADGADELRQRLERWTINGVARQSLELLTYIVKNDRPYTEIVTADYMVVNPFSARAYNIPLDSLAFTNDADPTEFVEARLDYDGNFVHAGMLTDPIWLQRHPTTQTNINRHRAKEVLYMFLGNDILKAAERPIAVNESALADNPTQSNPDCSVCHTVLDPIAGCFRNFQPTFNGDNLQFGYRPEASWFTNVAAPTGFGGKQTPPSEYPRAVQWLGQEIAKDPGFAFAAVYMGYRTLTGAEPLQPPAADDPEFDAKLGAFLGQYFAFSRMADDFRKSNYNYKSLMKALVMSPYFRAVNVAPGIESAQLRGLAGMGTAHFLTPEQLNRKIEHVVGIRWTPNSNVAGSANLLERFGGQGYRILFGGIDSRDTTQRITEPSGIMANVVERMGFEVGCRAVSAEFSITQEDRRWLKHVEQTTEPKDLNGYEVPDAVRAIKLDIQGLHEGLLHETLEIDDPEIARTYQLFAQVWEHGKAEIVPEMSWIPGECQVDYNYLTGVTLPEDERVVDDSYYTARAWSAVFAYLLTDFSFVYE